MKLSQLCIAISLAFAAQAHANDYSLHRSQPADTSRWQCSGCSSDGTWSGEVSAGVGYLNNDGSSRFYNWNPPVYGTNSDNKHFNASLNADIEQYEDDGFYNRIVVEDLGLQRFLLQWEMGQYDGLRILGSYSETPYFWNQSSLSAYHPREDALVSGDLSKYENSVTRETFKLELKYTPHTLWKPYASMKHERKEGTTSLYSSTIPSYANAPGFIPKAVDHETLNTQVGVSYIEDLWLVDIAYRGSFFRNDKSALYYGGITNPYANHLAYEPDNDFHQFAVTGNYRLNQQTFSGRLLWSQTSSEGGLNPFPQSPVNSNTFHGETNTWQMSADYHNKLSRDTAFAISADYSDKDDNSDRNTIIGSTREKYDHTKTKLETTLTHRVAYDVKVNAGYHFKQDERSYADRKRTDEQRVFVGAQYRPNSPWQLGGKVSYSFRDGSDWQDDSSDSPNLRQYYLADKERIELRGDGSYDMTDDVQLLAELWYGNDDYAKPDIGLSEGKDYGYDLSLNFNLLDGLSGHVFYNQQIIRSEQQQANSDVVGWNRYTTKLKDDITTIGFGVSKERLLDDKLSISFDYSYSQADSKSSTTSGGYQYPDNEANSYRFEVIADYEVSENQNVQLNLRYEDYSEEDYLFNNETGTMGDVLQSYEGLYGGVYWKYRF
ncbi:MtrB/PioB family decaheme-associated outer membrane protein [Vibrio parahaemolyticus]|uniref:MtrB/PioB family decaheme-associated outer membrane protein n=1 Tax=Vibrio parahaemolyticus TaxID=670 RepID=UPI00103728A3|nr:MtrB/PioB family decaheme-associated outer membrane protein [Vibrio parahaemolyticus]MDA0390022.1 MtrB/PioB family decaheme-associated outer membrane protein [Vibrio parahaemolyticus]MDA0394502.1 MtrB/PioB family decaheme-associated outer membrane protein [Vibrio parahaemolyticus]MDA0399124.1 MtrB/PioB family decaheme-associated outer membrane protein [Vibrio parahaemolyticus]MDA0403603.1 MtrB/PioB family decaheme-associated outer membrane protein [Vibrio parahaemolyticus]TBT03668.1 MtrB/Pi